MRRLFPICLTLILLGTAHGDYLKNTSSKIQFYAWDTANNVPKTGDSANITAYVRIDGGLLTQLADVSAAEISAANAPGSYEFDLTADETNGSQLFFSAVSATGSIYLAPIIANTKVGQTGDTYALANGVNGFAAIKSDTAAILVDTAAMDTANELRTLLTGSTDALPTTTTISTAIFAYSITGIGMTFEDLCNLLVPSY